MESSKPQSNVLSSLGRSGTIKQIPNGSQESGSRPSYVVVSGGTAANDFVSAFGDRCAFVLPVSDDGGSSSEILRCLGGPSIGDIRSRLIRLILLDHPDDTSPESSSKALARQSIYNLFAHRFPTSCREREAKDMWLDVVEGKSALWNGIPEDRRECIRAFFVHFNLLVLKRAHKRFSFRNFSLGNGFLSAARDMLGGLPGAIFMFKAITESQDTGDVLPIILTNQRITIAAELASGAVITGQCEISHPSLPMAKAGSATADISRPSSRNSMGGNETSSDSDTSDDEAVDPSHSLPKAIQGNHLAAPHRPTPLIRHIEPDMDSTSSFLPTSASSVLSASSAGTLPALLQSPGSPRREPYARPQVIRSHVALERDRPELRRVASGVDVNARTTGTGTLWGGDPAGTANSTTGMTVIDLDDVPGSNSLYVKGQEEVPLESRIERLFYINVYGQEIYPEPNAQVLNHLASKEVLVYSCGSLWTSIVPCLALRGMAKAIVRSKALRAKVVLLNCRNDRETTGYDSTDYITTIVHTLDHYNGVQEPAPATSHSTATSIRGSTQPGSSSAGIPAGPDISGRERRKGKRYPANRYITHLVHLEGGGVPVDEAELRELGIRSIQVPWDVSSESVEMGDRGKGTGKGVGGSSLMNGAQGQRDSPQRKARQFDVESVEWAMARVWEQVNSKK